MTLHAFRDASLDTLKSTTIIAFLRYTPFWKKYGQKIYLRKLFGCIQIYIFELSHVFIYGVFIHWDGLFNNSVMFLEMHLWKCQTRIWIKHHHTWSSYAQTYFIFKILKKVSFILNQLFKTKTSFLYFIILKITKEFEIASKVHSFLPSMGYLSWKNERWIWICIPGQSLTRSRYASSNCPDSLGFKHFLLLFLVLDIAQPYMFLKSIVGVDVKPVEVK